MQPVKDYFSAFDIVSRYVSTGFNLQDATLVDGNNRLELPIEVFEGQSFSELFGEMQQQWEEIFQEQPLHLATLDRQRYINWHRRLIVYYEQQINRTIKGILRLDKKQYKNKTLPNSSARLAMRQSYQSLLQSHNKRVTSLESARQKAVNILKKLEG